MKKQKFKAIKKKVTMPDSCFFHDLGDSNDFVETIHKFLQRKFPSELVRFSFESRDPRYTRAGGICYSFAIGHDTHSLVTYRPKSWYCNFLVQNQEQIPSYDSQFPIPKLAKNLYWRARGHEEGHVLHVQDLDYIIEEITGSTYQKNDKPEREAIADLCALHAVDVRGLGYMISQEKRKYMERAKYWKEIYKQAKENEIEANKKKSITAVMSAEMILEKIKEMTIEELF